MKISSIVCTVALSSGIDFNLTNQRITLKSKRNFPIRLSCELLRKKNLYICLTYNRTSAVKLNLTLSVAKIFSSWLREGTKNGFWIMILPRWYQKVPRLKKSMLLLQSTICHLLFKFDNHLLWNSPLGNIYMMIQAFD